MSVQRSTCVFLYAYSNGGDAVATAIRELADALDVHGSVRVLGLPTWLLRSPGGSVSNRIFRAAGELLFWVFAAIGIALRWRSIAYIVAVDVPSGIGLLGVLARRISRGRIRDVSWVMDIYRLGRPELSGLERVRASLEAGALKRAGAVVTLGNCMAGRLEGVIGRRPTVVPLWAPRHEVERLVLSRPRPLRLLYSGSARDVHPLRPLIAAVAKLQGTVELRINGVGTEIDRARALGETIGAANVTFEGPVSAGDLFRLYSWADFHVVSLSEDATGTCVPSKTYAAMGAGRGVLYLGSSEGQAAQDVAKAEAGVVVDPPTEVAIEKAVAALAGRPRDVEKMSERASTFAQSIAMERIRPIWQRILA